MTAMELTSFTLGSTTAAAAGIQRLEAEAAATARARVERKEFNCLDHLWFTGIVIKMSKIFLSLI